MLGLVVAVGQARGSGRLLDMLLRLVPRLVWSWRSLVAAVHGYLAKGWSHCQDEYLAGVSVVECWQSTHVQPHRLNVVVAAASRCSAAAGRL